MLKFLVKAQILCEKNSWIGFHTTQVESHDTDAAISQAENIFKRWGYEAVMALIAGQGKIEIVQDDIKVKINLIKELGTGK